MPFEYVAQWVARPKPMLQDEFDRAKAALAKQVSTMLQMGKQLVEDKKRLAQETRNMWMFTRWQAKRELKSQQH